MPRSRAFDEAAVLTGAMLAFRERGYAGVSVRELEGATGLSAGSLYNAFGDKEGLFRAAFARYFELVVDPRLDPARTLEDLERVFVGLFEPPMADGLGCLVTNTAVEAGAAPSAAADLARTGLDKLQAAFERVLRREMGEAAAAEAVLRLLLLYQGVLVVSRAGRNLAPYADVIRAEFSRLRSLRAAPTT